MTEQAARSYSSMPKAARRTWLVPRWLLKFIGPRNWTDPAVFALLDAYGAQRLPN
jgi:hypothetical protein